MNLTFLLARNGFRSSFLYSFLLVVCTSVTSLSGADRFFFEDADLAEGSTQNTIEFKIEHDSALSSFVSRFEYDPNVIDIAEVSNIGTDFETAFFYHSDVDPASGVVVIAAIIDIINNELDIPAGTHLGGNLIVDVLGLEGQSINLDLKDSPSGTTNFAQNPNHFENHYWTPGEEGTQVLPVLIDKQFTIGPPDNGNPVEPDIRVTPTSISFIPIFEGSSENQSLEIRNDGLLPLTISEIDLSPGSASEFQLSSLPQLPFVLGPQATHNIQVTFAPLSEGAFNGTIEIDSDDPDTSTAQVPLVGSGLAALEPDISVAPLDLTFPLTPAGENQSQNVTITNNGNQELIVNNLELSQNSDPEFQLIPPPSLPLLIAPSNSIDIQVQFTPSGEGTFNGTLFIDSDDPDSSSIQVQIQGSGFVPLVPNIQVNPSSYTFPTTDIGNTENQTLTINNLGNHQLTVTTIELSQSSDPEFQLSQVPPLPLIVPPQSFENIQVDFTPTAVGTFNGSVTIESDDPDSASVQVDVSGSGSVPLIPDIQVTPLDLNFPLTPAGETQIQAVTITNTGNQDLIVNTIELSQSSDPEFLLQNSPSVPLSITPQNSIEFQVEFTPSGEATFNGTLVINSNDPDTSSVQVPIEGSGFVPLFPNILVNPSSHTFSTTLIGNTVSQTLTINNLGNQQLTVSTIALSAGSDPDFQLSQVPSLPLVIPSQDFQTIQVDFTPTGVGTFNGSVTIESDDPDSPSVQIDVMGSGSVPVVPDIQVSLSEITFPSTLRGEIQSQSISITNTGTGELEIENLEIGGSTNFWLGFENELLFPPEQSTPPNTPIQIAPQEDFTFSVFYTSCEADSDQGTLTIQSNDPDEQGLEIEIIGTRFELTPQSSFVPYETIQDIFSSRCFGCHDGNVGGNNGQLKLSEKVSYGNLVGTQSLLIQDSIVRPFEPENSYLYEKMICNYPGVGILMPPTGLANSTDQQAIYDWIASGAPAPILPPGPLFKLNLDGNIEDSVGNANAVNINPLESSDNRFEVPDSAYRFTGGQLRSDLIFNEVGRLPITRGDFTFSFWFKAPSTGPNEQQTLFECSHGTSLGVVPRVVLTFNPSTSILRLRRGSQASLLSGSARNNYWHHVLLSKLNDQLALYVDGVRVGQAEDSDAFGGAYTIGGDANLQNRYRGFIDDVQYSAGGLSGDILTALSTEGPTAYLHPIPSEGLKAAQTGQSLDALVMNVQASGTNARPSTLDLRLMDVTGDGQANGFSFINNPRLIFKANSGQELVAGSFTTQVISSNRWDLSLEENDNFNWPSGEAGELRVRFDINGFAPLGRQIQVSLDDPEDLQFESSDSVSVFVSSPWPESSPVYSGATYELFDESPPEIQINLPPEPEPFTVTAPATDVILHELTLPGTPSRSLRVQEITYTTGDGVDFTRLENPRLAADLNSDGTFESSETIPVSSQDEDLGRITFSPPSHWLIPAGGSLDIVLVGDITSEETEQSVFVPYSIPKVPLIGIGAMLLMGLLVLVRWTRIEWRLPKLEPIALRMACLVLLSCFLLVIDTSCKSGGGGSSSSGPVGGTTPSPSATMQLGILNANDLRLVDTTNGFEATLNNFPADGIPGPVVTLE